MFSDLDNYNYSCSKRMFFVWSMSLRIISCLLLKQILKAKLVLPPYLGAEARSLLKKVQML